MAIRVGFGEQTGVSEGMELPQYEFGHIEYSQRAMRHAIEKYPKEPPAAAVGLTMAIDVGGADLADYVEGAGPADTDAIRDALTSVEGVGEGTADELIEALSEVIDLA